jgi:hypothetical protein
MDANTRNTRLVWFLLVDSDGLPYKGTSPTKVSVPSVADVDEFRSAVKAKHTNKLASVDAADLKVSKNKIAFDGNEELEVDVPIGELGSSAKDPIIVLVPSQGNYETLGRLLSLTLPSPVMAGSDKSISTHHSVHARDPLVRREWSTFEASVRALVQSIEARNKKVARPVRYENVSIRSESNVNEFVGFNVVRFLMDIDGKFTIHNPFSSSDFLGRPDFGIVDDAFGQLILVFELKCPWVIGTDLDLVNAQNKKTQHIIAQLNGYMYLNNLSFGVLSTYTYWWFFMRDGDNGLLISKCYPHDSKDPTILQCVYFLIALGRERPQKLPITTREVKVFMKNGGTKVLMFEERLHRGNYSDVWRVTFQPEGKPGIFKLMDKKCGKTTSVKLIDNEVEVYEKLDSLQGELIPVFEGVGKIGDVLYGFVTSFEGESLRQKVPTDSEVLEVEYILKEMHKLGVAHGDVRLPNIVKSGDGKIKLIDFGMATLSATLQDKKSDLEELETLKDGGRDAS